MNSTQSEQSSSCILIFAFDVGQIIDLKKVATQSAKEETLEAAQVTAKKGVTSYFGYNPPPIRIVRSVEKIILPLQFENLLQAQVRLWDFGSLSIRFEIPIPEETSLDDLITLSSFLVEDDSFSQEAFRLATQIVDEYRFAITNANITDVFEDYVLFRLTSIEQFRMLSNSQSSLKIAQLLRGEETCFSEEIQKDALSLNTSYTADDIVTIDWNAALLAGSDDPDIIAVLESAQVQLLEMRSLDRRLDSRLEKAYAAFTSTSKKSQSAVALNKLALLSVDSASSFESVNSALYIVGDQFLARIYQLCVKRFELLELSRSVSDKLQALDGIYQKLVEAKRADRSELLEIVIIVLIFIELVKSLTF